MEQIVTAAMAALVALFGANDVFAAESGVTCEDECVTADYVYYEQEYADYYEPEYYEEYMPPYDADDGIDAYEFQYLGVIEEDGVTYTYYSENVLPGGGLTELNENGRHSEDGFVKDGDGYIAVASSDYEIGTVVDTPFGEGKVYDTGCAEGVVDIYVSF